MSEQTRLHALAILSDPSVPLQERIARAERSIDSARAEEERTVRLVIARRALTVLRRTEGGVA